jgi:hypothetical protein
MFHARGKCGLGSRFVPAREIRSAVDQENRVNSLERRRECPRIREITDHHIRAIAVSRSRLLRVAHKHSRPLAALDQEFRDAPSDTSRRARD